MPQTANAEDVSADGIVRRWIETNLGPVTHFERQERWRPAWFVEAERDGKPLSLYVRGDREGVGDVAALQTRHEAAILQVMDEHGVLVPQIHGMIETPSAVVMERLAGRANLATAADDAERASVLAHYMDLLVKVHAIDPARFSGLGLPLPENSDQFFESYVARHRAGKKRAEPLIEFAIKWLRLNAPAEHGARRFVLGDPGQFMFEDGRVTGLLDVELAHFGDPEHDLAGLRLRNLTEPLGDLASAFQRYAAATGRKLNANAIEFHTARFALCTPMSLTAAVHGAAAIPEIIQYLEWFLQYQLCTIEMIATLAGVGLTEPDLPSPSAGPYTGIAASLPAMIESLVTASGIDRFRRAMTATVARFCHRLATHGTGIDAEDFAEQESATGIRATSRHEADAALEAFVLTAGPEYDAKLIALLFRRIMRQMKLIEPLLNRSDGIGRVPPAASLLNWPDADQRTQLRPKLS